MSRSPTSATRRWSAPWATSKTTSSTTRKKRTTTSTRPEPVVLALGGNVPGPWGSVERTLARALACLETLLGELRVAPLHRSAAVSPVPQPDYLNTVALAHTGLDPGALLGVCKALERAAGRRRPTGAPRFGPRPLDVDIVLWGDRISDRPELTLPHPRLRERRFVLEPLAAIAPDLRVPPDGATVAELLERLERT